MSKDVLLKYTKYADSIKSKLLDTNVPEKHKNRPKQYRELLERELKKVNAKIDSLKLSNDGKAK